MISPTEMFWGMSLQKNSEKAHIFSVFSAILGNVLGNVATYMVVR